MANEVFELLGKVLLVGGGASVVAYQVFKHLAASWLDARFAKNLQQLVHDQNKEIERLRNDLTKSFDRATKLHQREFEILPTVWDGICEAYWRTASLVSPLQSMPDINRMRGKQLESFVAQSELADWQKEEVLAATDKTKAYNDAIYWHKLNRVDEVRRMADVTLSTKGIFVPDLIKEKLQSILDLVRGALLEDRMNHEEPPIRNSERLHTSIDRIFTDGKAWMHEAETMIKAKLWDHN